MVKVAINPLPLDVLDHCSSEQRRQDSATAATLPQSLQLILQLLLHLSLHLPLHPPLHRTLHRTLHHPLTIQWHRSLLLHHRAHCVSPCCCHVKVKAKPTPSLPWLEEAIIHLSWTVSLSFLLCSVLQAASWRDAGTRLHIVRAERKELSTRSPVTVLLHLL